MTEPTISEQESLLLIRSMINKARDQFTENGHLYLLWGWMGLICSTGHFLMQTVLHFRYAGWIWLLTFPTLIYQLIYLRRKLKQPVIRTYTDELVGYVWIVACICTALLLFLLVPYLAGTGCQVVIWLTMYGMPTILSGAVVRYRGLLLGGICCWILAIFSYFVPVQYHLLLLSVAVTTGWILPGYGMQQKFRAQNTQMNYYL